MATFPAMNDRCGKCGRELGAGESISVAGVGERCYPCFNEENAARMGVEFDDRPVQPIELTDADGVTHRFEIQSVLVATGREMIAQEVPRPEHGGYRFAVLGDYKADSRAAAARPRATCPRRAWAGRLPGAGHKP